MIIIEKNEGTKIPYEVSGTKICFDDDLTLNLAKRQKDDCVEHIDVCSDWDGDLTTSTKGAKAYVAQIDIPAAEYEGEDEEQVKKDLDMDKVTLTLWSID